MYEFPLKYSPPQRIRLPLRCFHFLKRSWYDYFVMTFVAFAFISEIVSNRLPLTGFFKFWEQEKATRSKVRWVRWVGKNSDRVFGQKLTSSEWIGALLWCKNQLSLLHSSGLLRRTAFLSRFSTSDWVWSLEECTRGEQHPQHKKNCRHHLDIRICQSMWLFEYQGVFVVCHLISYCYFTQRNRSVKTILWTLFNAQD